MVLKLEKVPNNPRMIALFWEGSLFRTVCKFLFLKELEKLPAPATQEELSSYLTQIEQKEGKRYAVSLLSKRALLSSQLEKKLSLKGISRVGIQTIVQFCMQRGYLDDATQTTRLITRELKKGRSRRAIYSKLAGQKGVDPELLNPLLNSSVSSDEEALDLWIAKHAKKFDATDFNQRRKIWQKLSALGFSSDLIRKKIVLEEEEISRGDN